MMSNDTETHQHPPVIYLDADACPVKDLVYKVAARYGVPLKVVANVRINVPQLPSLQAEAVVVPGSPDAADDWIAERATTGDLVLTSDIPLAARAIASGARCIDFRGGEFNPNRIGDALAARDLNAHLRSVGLVTGGPASFSQKDRSKFASLLDAAVNKLARHRAASASQPGNVFPS
jgi:uncharacterized protein